MGKKITLKRPIPALENEIFFILSADWIPTDSVGLETVAGLFVSCYSK
ncbi:hypothetical protein C943_01588 [Mariniradius saccharolyticus AK6]|uniref:Uncharacterized protein n=1 Tax=Mariniradius saccharolyticus AK6 TaxID=1239962 RepID=M7XBN8_9BACT|nr:hypothetical protein C943_01588 [Mariniradius saccharolyticus AK6]